MRRKRSFLRLAVFCLATAAVFGLGQPARAQNPLLDALGITSSSGNSTLASGAGAPPTARQGQDTQAQAGPTAPATLGSAIGGGNGLINDRSTPPQQPLPLLPTQLQPFGANLFGSSAAPPSATQTINPNYQIQPGDSVNVQVWGGVTAQSSTIVDPEGNIFLQGVGPIHVAGVRAADLQATVKHTVGGTFTQNVQIYAVLQGVHQINVYVTGFVAFPGRYAGSATDSALDYLVRAGGVDPTRGSYRDISLRRDGKALATIDLYDFLLRGTPLPVNLREGDTIVVGKQMPMVGVAGSVRNNFLFEVPTIPVSGKTVIDLARPLPVATHGTVQGTRNGQPYALYGSLSDLSRTTLYDQDQINIVADAPPQTVSVQIQGSRLGPSILVADNNTRIADLLNYVAVDPRLADTKSIYILRQGLAQKQQRAIQDAADRLEKSLYLAISETTGVSQIRASDAQLVASYIQHARQIAPEGRLVVTDDNGRLADIRLENNDVIVIPEKSQVVMVTGEVLYPQAVVYDPSMTADQYAAAAGGFTERGERGNYLIRRSNGSIILDASARLRPGDELVALPYVSPELFQLGKDVLQAAYEIAIATYAIKNF